jgi:hypothetical protein
MAPSLATSVAAAAVANLTTFLQCNKTYGKAFPAMRTNPAEGR